MSTQRNTGTSIHQPNKNNPTAASPKEQRHAHGVDTTSQATRSPTRTIPPSSTRANTPPRQSRLSAARRPAAASSIRSQGVNSPPISMRVDPTTRTRPRVSARSIPLIRKFARREPGPGSRPSSAVADSHASRAKSVTWRRLLRPTLPSIPWPAMRVASRTGSIGPRCARLLQSSSMRPVTCLPDGHQTK
jgi:hypothetical protein